MKLLSNPRGRRGGRAVSLLLALALTAVTSVLTAGPAAATDSCGTSSTSTGYSVTACGGYDSYGVYHGWLYVTLPANHVNCTIRGKITFQPTYDGGKPTGYAQTWTCPAGAITNAFYEIDYSAPGLDASTTGSILNSSGYTILVASGGF